MTGRIRIAQGCYVDRDAGLAERCAAVLARCPPETTVVGTAAATLHELWLPAPATMPEIATYQPGRRPAGMNRSHRAAISTRRQAISPAQVTSIAGVAVTDLARTWWDLASVLSLPDLVAVGDHVLQKGCARAELAELTRRLAGHRGNARARTALPLLDGRSRSRPESHLRVAVVQAGLDCFEVNRAVHDQYGGWLAEPDLSCRASRIALEYQGIEHASADRMRRDITRQSDLRRAQWLTLYYGPAEVFGRPWQIGPELRRLHAGRVATSGASG